MFLEHEVRLETDGPIVPWAQPTETKNALVCTILHIDGPLRNEGICYALIWQVTTRLSKMM